MLLAFLFKHTHQLHDPRKERRSARMLSVLTTTAGPSGPTVKTELTHIRRITQKWVRMRHVVNFGVICSNINSIVLRVEVDQHTRRKIMLINLHQINVLNESPTCKEAEHNQ